MSSRGPDWSFCDASGLKRGLVHGDRNESLLVYCLYALFVTFRVGNWVMEIFFPAFPWPFHILEKRVFLGGAYCMESEQEV